MTSPRGGHPDGLEAEEDEAQTVRGKWYDYSRARDEMFRASDTSWAHWYIAHTDDKKRARLNIISHLLLQVPYKPLEHKDVKLPKRQQPKGYVEPSLSLQHIPEKY